MKQFNQFIKGLSLTQQLFALIAFFVTFFSAFFFIYINNSVDNAIKEQVFETLDNTQLALLGASNAIGDDSIYSEADQTITYTIVVKGNNLVLAYNNAYSNKPDLNSNEWKQICQDVLKCYNHNDGKP